MRACAGVRCEACPAPQLLPEATGGVLAYLMVATQWRIGMGGRTGLDYTAALAVIDRNRAKFKRLGGARQAFADVQTIEHAFLDADSERREQEKAAQIGADE